MSEPGKDLSNPPGETKCFICGVWVDEDSYTLHISWHDVQQKLPHQTANAAANQFGIYTGIPVEEAINKLADQIQMLTNEKYLLMSQVNTLQTAIMDIQNTIGTEGRFRFLRDWSQV